MVAAAAFVAAVVLLLRQESRDGRYLDSGSAVPLGTHGYGAAVRGGVQPVKVLPRPRDPPSCVALPRPVCHERVKRARARSAEGRAGQMK